MRVTNSMVVNNMIRNLNKNYSKMDKLNQQLSTNRKFITPSDDPIGVSRSLRLNTEKSTMEQYKRNADDAQSWIDTTEIATNSIISVLQRARELTVQAANTTNSIQERKNISDEIEQLKQTLISIGNTSYAGSYIFSGFKTDQALLKSDGTYDLGGGTLNSNENIQFNVGLNDKIGVNFVGQRIFGYVESTVKEQYEIEAGDKFSGCTIGASNDEFVLNYNGVDYTIDLDDKTYTSSDASTLADDINAKIAADPAIKDKIKVEVSSGKLKFISAKPITIKDGGVGTSVNLSSSFKITSGTSGQLNYVNNIDSGNLDASISMGRYDNILKAGGAFGGLTVSSGNDTFVISYQGKKYDIKLDPKTYTSAEGSVFCLDVNNKIKSIPALSGHVNFSMQDGRINIVSDMPASIENSTTSPIEDATGVANMNFTDGDSTVKAAYILESSAINPAISPIIIAAAPNNQFVINYDGAPKYLTLTQNVTYDGSPTKTLDDLTNDIQNQINADPSLKGHVTVQNEDGRITFYSDKSINTMNGFAAQNAITTTVPGDTLSTAVNVTAANNTFTINYNGANYDITLDVPSNFTTLTGLTSVIQSKINENPELKGHVFATADTNLGKLKFSADEKITVKDAGTNPLNVTAFGLPAFGQSSDSINNISIRAGKNSIPLNTKVDSGAQTQLIGVFDALIKDLRADNTEGISHALKRLDMQVANVSAVRAEIGVKTNRIELTINRIEDDKINIKGLLSKNEDIDMSEVIMNLKMEESVYNASLSVGARIIQPSLVDFLN